jgi:DnaD/phage-associated family protein
MSKLLINEPPLQVLPSLAVAVGLNEAIVIQQIHYWLSGKAGKIIDGQRWIFNGYSEWQEQFPFWSNATIYRIFAKLEREGIVISKQPGGYDRRKWYTLDYIHLLNLTTSISSTCLDGTPQPEEMLTEIPENKAEKQTANALSPDLSSVIRCYESNIGAATWIMVEEFRLALAEYTLEWIETAIAEAVKHNVRKWPYVLAVLKTWKRDGFRADNRKKRIPNNDRSLPFNV